MQRAFLFFYPPYTGYKHEKSEILVESLGGVGGGILFSVATVLLMTTPVGWVAALVIGAGSVAAGYAGSSIAKNTYNTYFKNTNLTKLTGVNRICH